jgi:hypothetical protein
MGLAVGLIWNVLGAAISILGVITLAELYAATHAAAASISLEAGELLPVFAVTAALLFVLVLAHELIHGLVMAAFGARPRFGVGAVASVLPYMYCTAEAGRRFTKGQFGSIALAPAVLLTVAGVLAVAWAPGGGWLVVPLGLHLGGCVGDFWLLSLAARQPPGTAIEDLRSGVRFHRPAADGGDPA